MIPFLLGLLAALPIAFLLARRTRPEPTAHAEFWVYSESEKPLDSPRLKASLGELPGDLFTREGIDPWTFSDVRWRLGDGDRKTAPHAFDPSILDVSPDDAVEITRATRVTKLLFAGPVAAEGFPLATVTAAALAAARDLSATRIWDHVARRMWTPRALADAVRAHGLTSPEVHLREVWRDDARHAVLRVLGFRKRAMLDLETLPVPVDLRLITEEAVTGYARSLWRAEPGPYRYEAYGDTFEIAARSGRRITRLRIYRRGAK